MMGIEKDDTSRNREESGAGVEIVNDHQVVFHLQIVAARSCSSTISANADLAMESKARWDAGGKELYGQKVIGTGPFEFVERKVGAHVLYKRVENHWRKTPEFKELEFRWVPEGVTRLATLLAEEVHISDVERSLQKDAVAKGMKVIPSTQPAMAHWWVFGGMYKQIPRSSRRNALPVKRINGSLLMGHEHLAGALVELMQIAKTPSCANRVLHHPPEAFDGVEVVPTMGG